MSAKRADQYAWEQDPVLTQLVSEGESDPEIVGLILSGSRGAGCANEDSDYDLLWVLTDAAYQDRKERGESLGLKERSTNGVLLDVGYTSVRELHRVAAQPGWWTPGYTTARVLLEKTGEVTPAVHAIATMPEDKAQADAGAWFDAYLNAFHRSLKAWRRGDELGARLQAAESAMHLVRTLFSLERRWPPYHDRLHLQLEILESQGWPPGMLYDSLLNLLRTADPKLQQQLEGRVEALMRARGFGSVLDAWGDDIERVKDFNFDETDA